MTIKGKQLFGCKATDIITGFMGIITAYSAYMTGCDQYYLTGKCKDNEKAVGCWFDENRLTYDIKDPIVLPGLQPEEKPKRMKKPLGGPQDSPSMDRHNG